jgi:hypothetical protein
VQNPDTRALRASLDVGSVGNTLAPSLMTRDTARDLWQLFRDSPLGPSLTPVYEKEFTAEELDAIIAECESPKGKDRMDSILIETLPHQQENISWHEWILKPSSLPPTEEMRSFDDEARMWEDHLNFLHQAGFHAMNRGPTVQPYPQPGLLELADEMMRFGRETSEDWWQGAADWAANKFGANKTDVERRG